MKVIIAGCVLALFPLLTTFGVAADNSAENVTFVVSISGVMFSEEAEVRVAVLDAEQMKIAEETSECTVSYDLRTKKEKIVCPKGVKYRKVTPEEFAFPVRELGENIEITSKTIKVGDEYSLSISGLSEDDCNTTSASSRGRANSQTITLDGLSWRTTEMWCEPKQQNEDN